MFFKRKPKPPLKDAVRLVNEAVGLIRSHWRDRSFQPSEADVRVFRDVEMMLFRSAAAARRIATRMERRLNGEPEFYERRWPDER